MSLCISIIVPVYRGEQFLERLAQDICTCQVLGKGLITYELIFVCDDPIDRSTDVAHSLCDRYEFVRAIELSCNSGQHLATAIGIMHANGSWLATLDEDLQHSPNEIPRMLRKACLEKLDIVYSKSESGSHKSFLNFRNLSSRLSKWLLKSVTAEDFTITSSFRLMRAELGQAVAFSIDRNSYLDAALFRCTSQRRRGVYLTKMIDERKAGANGYTLQRLIQHYGRLTTSIDISASRLSSKMLMVFFSATSCLSIVYIWTGIASAVMQTNPGWISLFSMLSINILITLLSVSISLKFLSLLVSRSNGSLRFLVIDRSRDFETIRLLDETLI